MADFDRESMLDMFIFEMNQLIEQLEQTIVQSETGYNVEQINEIFRIMHTIKGSAAMMLFDNIVTVAHAVEDLFYYLREESPQNIDYPTLSDHVLEGSDFIKAELKKIQDGLASDGDGTELVKLIKQFLDNLKNPQAANEKETVKTVPADPVVTAASPASAEAEEEWTSEVVNAAVIRYRAIIKFEPGCEMENIRAYTLVYNLGDLAQDVTHTPEDVIDEESIGAIRENGFILEFTSQSSYSKIYDHLFQTVYLSELVLEQISNETLSEVEVPEVEVMDVQVVDQPKEVKYEEAPRVVESKPQPATEDASQVKKSGSAPTQRMISVNVAKLDGLQNLMGELVIAEAMVTQNADLDGLQLDSFQKEASQLKKIINNLQETVTSMRMVPLSGTLLNMHRIVRDMCRALGKEVQLDILGEETEVDKNIIEHISDPITHIIRNSIDHGIEMPAIRRQKGKPDKGNVILEAKIAGGDVLISITDDGAGLDREKILKKAREGGLLRKPESEYTDKEIHQFIFMPAFSTNDEVTSYSGRGVGMDIVTANLEVINGTVLVDSVPGEGSTFTLKIPSTMAIIKGMSVLMAGAKYTIPIESIITFFNVSERERLFVDPNGNEMIAYRNEVYNIVRLYEFFNVEGANSNIEEGILVMLENGDQTICLLVDDLLGEQSAVVKPIPKYFGRVKGLGGCTLLGNGDISLIIDVPGLFDK